MGILVALLVLLQSTSAVTDGTDKPFRVKLRESRLCGDLKLAKYKPGTEGQIAPWNALIVTTFSKRMHCFGVLIPSLWPRSVNGSDLVLSASSCGHRHGRKLRSLSARVFFGVRTFPFKPHKASLYYVKKLVPLVMRLNNLEKEKAVRDDGLLILQLRKTVPSSKIMPVCLADYGAYPPPDVKCYSILKKRTRIAFIEQNTTVPKNPKRQFCQYGSAVGLCLWAHRFAEFVVVGSALYCEINGSAYLYGIFRSNEVELRTSTGTQWAGFFVSLHVFYSSLLYFKRALDRMTGLLSSQHYRSIQSAVKNSIRTH